MFNKWYSVTKINNFINEYTVSSNSAYDRIRNFNFQNSYKKDSQFLYLFSDESCRYSYVYNLINLLNTINFISKGTNYTSIIDNHTSKIDTDEKIYNKIVEFYKLHKHNMDKDDLQFYHTIYNNYTILGTKNKNVSKIKENIDILEKKIHNSSSSDTTKYKILMKCVDDSSERKKLELYNSTRFYDSIIDIAALIVNRNNYAKSMNYKNYTHFKYRNTTIKNTDTTNMLDFLTKYINDLDATDFFTMVKAEKTSICTWDIDYYCNKFNEMFGKYSINKIVPSVLLIFENLFGVKFVLKCKKKINRLINHEYTIKNGDNELGNLDIVEMDTMVSECIVLNTFANYYGTDTNYEKNTVLLPNIVITLPNKSKSYNCVSTIFKNIFYAVHNCLNKNKYNIFSGSNTSKDNIELVTKLIDFVCWDSRIISSLTNENKQNVTNIKNNKIVTSSIIDLRYCVLSIFDIVVYTPDFIKKITEIVENRNKTTEQKKKDLITVFVDLTNYFIKRIINDNVVQNEGILYPDILEYLIDDYDWFSILYANSCADKIFTKLCSQNKNMHDIIKIVILPLYKKFSYNYYESIDSTINILPDDECDFNDSDDNIQTENTETLKRYDKYMKGIL